MTFCQMFSYIYGDFLKYFLKQKCSCRKAARANSTVAFGALDAPSRPALFGLAALRGLALEFLGSVETDHTTNGVAAVIVA
jgi:hypothetical protein